VDPQLGDGLRVPRVSDGPHVFGTEAGDARRHRLDWTLRHRMHDGKKSKKLHDGGGDTTTTGGLGPILTSSADWLGNRVMLMMKTCFLCGWGTVYKPRVNPPSKGTAGIR
jgi:hypothetical protein